jgi:hypothetical protein
MCFVLLKIKGSGGVKRGRILEKEEYIYFTLDRS